MAQLSFYKLHKYVIFYTI